MNSIISQVPILLLISFDGFRHDYLSPALTPNLYEISHRSTVGNMRSLFVTKTFPNHFSIATGLYEDEHEIVNNKMFDPRIKTPFSTSTVSQEWWDPKNRTIPIWTANQLMPGRFSGSMMYPGSVTPYQGVVPVHLKPFDQIRNWTHNVDNVIDWLTHEHQPANFVSLYFDNPDHVAHNYGPFSPQVYQSLSEIDHAAGYLMQQLNRVGLIERTNIIFVSDHGMAEVSQRIYLNKFVATESFVLHGASPVWSLWFKPNALNMKNFVYKQLKTVARQNHFNVYRRHEIPSQYHYSKTLRVGHLFIISDEGYDIHVSPSVDWTVNHTVWGNHGWSPTSEDMRPLFMATGPAFKAGYYHEQQFSNIDLFPLMCYILDLPLNKLPNNGSLDNISDILAADELHEYSIGLCYVTIFGIILLICCAGCMILVASCRLRKSKVDYDTDALAPGLNIDLEFYLDYNGTKQLNPRGLRALQMNNEERHLLLIDQGH